MHQDRIETIIASIQEGYPQAALQFRERRERPPRRDLGAANTAPVHYTGRMHEYDQ